MRVKETQRRAERWWKLNQPPFSYSNSPKDDYIITGRRCTGVRQTVRWAGWARVRFPQPPQIPSLTFFFQFFHIAIVMVISDWSAIYLPDTPTQCLTSGEYINAEKPTITSF